MNAALPAIAAAKLANDSAGVPQLVVAGLPGIGLVER
jgi:hypothetical protein